MPDNVEVSEDGLSSTFHYNRQPTKSIDDFAADALERMDGNVAMAANLLLRWSESDPVRSLLPDLVREYIEARVRARAESSTNPDSGVASNAI